MADDIADLIVAGAYETGLLKRESVDGLLAIEGVTDKIALGLGEAPPDRKSVFIVTILVDDSDSIFLVGNNSGAIATGHNDAIDELKEVSGTDPEREILVSTRYLNGRILNPYTTLDRVSRMNAETYQFGGGTPLYDQSVITLGTVIAKTVQLTRADIEVRTFTLIITDGKDMHSKGCDAKSVAWLAGDMLISGSHILAAMGVSDGRTRFKDIFQEMGIKPGWILEPDNSREKIREAFRTVTDQLRLAAGSEDEFAKLALGPGFA